MRFNAAEASKNREFQGQQLNQAQQYNTQEAEKARQYNTWLLSNSTQRNVQDARAAGLNPAFMNGSVLGSTPSPSVAASSAGAPGSQASVGSLGISPLDLSAPFSLLSNLMMQKAAVRKNNADAERQEILNERMKEEDREFGINDVRYVDRNGVPIENVDEWQKENPNEIPTRVNLSWKGAKGRFDAKRALNLFNKEVSDVHVDVLRNALTNKILSMQKNDPEVMIALAQLPFAQYNQLLKLTQKAVKEATLIDKQVSKIDIENAILTLEKQIKEDSNVYQYVNKMFSGDFSLKDLAKLFVMTIVGLVGRVGVSIKP